MLSAVEQTRLKVSVRTEAKKKSLLGQFLTPENTASFMAGLFPASSGTCRLLDAGAGIGSLSSAFLERCTTGNLNFDKIQLKAFEIDDTIHNELRHSLSPYLQKGRFSFEIFGNDFIEEAVNAIQFKKYNFTHAILNPPYKKIGSCSKYRLLLRQVGIETVNLYSAFVALAVALAAPGGQIVAIIPRSFCNGPYYRPFRDFILERAAIRHIHLFESRSQAFNLALLQHLPQALVLVGDSRRFPGSRRSPQLSATGKGGGFAQGRRVTRRLAVGQGRRGIALAQRFDRQHHFAALVLRHVQISQILAGEFQ